MTRISNNQAKALELEWEIKENWFHMPNDDIKKALGNYFSTKSDYALQRYNELKNLEKTYVCVNVLHYKVTISEYYVIGDEMWVVLLHYYPPRKEKILGAVFLNVRKKETEQQTS